MGPCLPSNTPIQKQIAAATVVAIQVMLMIVNGKYHGWSFTRSYFNRRQNV
jgi:hypothetical protein